MEIIVATFGQPEDISGTDDTVYRFPVTLVNMADIGTPRQSSNTEKLRVKAIISGTSRTRWPPEPDLLKAMFQLAKEHLVNARNSHAWKAEDLEVIAKEFPCPYDVNQIEEPLGAVIEIPVQRPIGF